MASTSSNSPLLWPWRPFSRVWQHLRSNNCERGFRWPKPLVHCWQRFIWRGVRLPVAAKSHLFVRLMLPEFAWAAGWRPAVGECVSSQLPGFPRRPRACCKRLHSCRPVSLCMPIVPASPSGRRRTPVPLRLLCSARHVRLHDPVRSSSVKLAGRVSAIALPMAAHSVARSGEEQRGITLIESLMALAVITGGVLGIATMLVNGMVQQRTAATQSAANTLLADGFETLQVTPLLPPATAASDIATWRTRVALALPSGAAGAAATVVTPQVLVDGSHAQALQLSFASAGRSTDTTLDVLAVTTAWPAGGP